MIGFFDSGLGGLTVLREVEKLLPQYSYLYFGDNRNAPYGTCSQEEIFDLTLAGVEFLFSHGAKLVILSCNTSSSSALRKIQQEVLPKKYPDKNVLGIIIPTAEELFQYTKNGEVGVLATPATVESGAYVVETKKVSPNIKVWQQACPELVPAIEGGASAEEINKLGEFYLEQLFSQSKNIDVVLLGCTHYAIIEKQIEKLLPEEVKIISQGKIVAEKLKNYLGRHPERENKIKKGGERFFYTSGQPEKVSFLAKKFYGQSLDLKRVER